MNNSNYFDNKSEIIAKLILNKIFSYVGTEIKKNYIEKKIPLFCGEYIIDYYIIPLVSLNKFLLVKKEESNKKYNDLFLDYTNLKQENTWVEIKEPSTPIKERSMTTNLKVINNENDYNFLLNGLIDNLGIQRIGLETIDINKFSNNSLLKRSNSQIISKKVILNTKSLFEMNKKKNNKKKESKNQIFSNFKVYDIPNFKNIPFEEPRDYQKLREIFEKEKIKKLEELKKEKEKEKRKKLNIFNFTNKKDFDSKKYTFDSNGQVIQYHPYKLHIISNELLESKSIVGKTKIENNLNQLPIIENNMKMNHNLKNKKIRIDKNKKYSLKNNEENKRKRIPIPPAGSNFNIIKPEIGVIIHENDKVKGGNMNFVSKYNKTSIEEYSKMIREKNFSNCTIPINKILNKQIDKKDKINSSKKKEQINKNNDIKKENENLLDSHYSISPNIHYMNDNNSFAINFQGTNKNFHSVNISQNDININHSLFSNRNKSLLNHSISTIYNDNINANNDYSQGKIFVKDSFFEFKKSLMESDSDLKNNSNNFANNYENTQLSKNYSSIYLNKRKNSILNLKSINKNLFKISPSTPSLLKLNKKFVEKKKKFNKFL